MTPRRSGAQLSMGPRGGVQECVQEWKHKGCESQFRPSHPVRLTPQCFTYLAKMPSFFGLLQSQACCQLHQGAPYPKTIPSARPGERGSKIKVGSGTLRRGTERPVRTVGYHSPLPTPLSRSARALDTELQAWPLATS